MTGQALVRLAGVGKSFPQIFRTADRLRALYDLIRGRYPEKASQVLSNINLTVYRGQSLGLIGMNGAGKSTLLKVITGVLTASSGSIEVAGKIAPLLELGAGFHPEYSGRENIRLNAILLGMSNAQIEEKLESIIAFADIGHYIDEPVKHYSSGMVVRLGFAVVAATKPDLLITDEVLAVGDESFQKKCVQWIETYLAEGGTLLLVSHSMYHIQKLCRQACWLHEGKIRKIGDVFEVTQDYLAWHERKSAAEIEQQRENGATGEYSVAVLKINGELSAIPQLVPENGVLEIEVSLSSRDGRKPVLLLGVKRADGTPVYGVSTEMEAVAPWQITDGKIFTWRASFDLTLLLPGTYLLMAHAMDPEGLRLFDTMERTLTIRGNSRELGMVQLPHRWNE